MRRDPNPPSPAGEPVHCPSCHSQVPAGAQRCPQCGCRDLPVYADGVQVRGPHVAVAIVLHVALLFSTYHLLGVGIPGVAVMIVLFFLFPALTNAVAKAWPK